MKRSVVEKNEPLTLLKESPPFLFLTEAQQYEIAEQMELHHYKEKDIILQKNEPDLNYIYLVNTGLVRTSRDNHVINVIKRGHYFGEQQIILDEEYTSNFVAMRETSCYVIAKELFLKILRTSKVFAEAIGTMLRDDQGIFFAFESFTLELLRNTNLKEFSLEKIINLYKKLSPVLHRGVDSQELDFVALFYAVKRLPVNLTRTFSYMLTDDLPTEFLEPDKAFTVIPSAARRRNIWEMLPGKNMVLIRSGLSDLLDIITCLCVYAVEAKKLRIRLHNPKLISLLMEHKTSRLSETEEVLNALPLSESEKKSLLNIWGHESTERLIDIVRHREQINIHVRRRVINYNIRRMELWTKQIGVAAQELLGYLPNDLPEEYDVHIISSNSHSVTNCLNPALIEQKNEIMKWAKECDNPLLKEQWYNSYDLLYAISRFYYKNHPSKLPSRADEKKQGILRLRETASTGIEVQLFDLKKLYRGASDPGIIDIPVDKKILLVNIDYAFGEQAEDIIRNLIFLFGRNLKSINIMGKAGSLIGNRGDILLPSGFIEQSSDTFHPITNTVLNDYESLKKRLPERNVYTGQLLTVAGTLLQNKMMLNFYHNLWNCVGLEMEGFYYFRQILKSMQLGVISEDISLRFLYYVSDLPLEKGVSLSVPLLASEGIPPLYAVTRHILSSIFEGKTK